MSLVNGRIIAPVGLFEVAAQLNEKFNLDDVCLSDYINIFARYKPQAILASQETPGVITEAQRKQTNYGITPFSFTNYRNVVNYCNGNLNGWSWQKPKTWYRLTDFCSEDGKKGYWHNAPKIVNFVKILNDNVANYAGAGSLSNLSFVVSLPVQNGYYDEAVTLDLLFPDILGSRFYFGIYITNGTQSRRVTGTVPLGRISSDMYDQIEFSAVNIPAGNWKAYPFLSSVQMSLGDEDTVATFYSLPYAYPIPFTIYSQATAVVVTLKNISFNSSYTTFTATIEVKNATAASLAFTNASWRARLPGKSFNDELEVMYEKFGSINNFTIAANSTQTISFSGSVNRDLSSQEWVLWVSLFNNSTVYERQLAVSAH